MRHREGFQMDESKRKPKVRVKPSNYRPTKAELEEVHCIDADPEDVIRALFRPVKVTEDSDA